MMQRWRRMAHGSNRAAAMACAAAIAGFAGALAMALPAAAQPRHGHPGRFRGHPGFHGYPAAHWRGGHWRHGWHGRRYGWWWIAPGFGWTFYPAPIYPYPAQPAPYIAPPAYVPPPAAPAPATWYYCADPAGYYPYVQRCTVPWQPVPAH
jgi:hypothetical protein